MLKIKLQIAEKILDGVKSINSEAELCAEDIAAMLEYPPDTSMGDLAFPCFKLSKALRRSPVQIAATIAEGLSCSEEPTDAPDLAHYDSLSEITLGHLFGIVMTRFLE